jgi:uncharacterized protein YjbJ (UPF0337 family)
MFRARSGKVAAELQYGLGRRIHMNQDEKEGKRKNLQGRVKEAFGTLTGNEDLEAEGADERADGAVQEKIGKASRKLGEAIEELGRKIKK